MADSVGVTHQEAMMLEWETDSRIFSSGHYQSAKHVSLWNDITGFSVVGLTAVAGSTVFANLGSSPSYAWRLAAGIISIAASVIAAEKKYLRLEERASKHQEAGRAHQSLLQEIEVLMSRLQDGGALADADIDRIKNRRDEIEKSAPTIPERFYRRSRENVLKCSACPRRIVSTVIGSTAA